MYDRFEHTGAHQASDHDADLSSEENDAEYTEAPNSFENYLEDYCDNEASNLPFSPPSCTRISKRSKERVRRNSGKKSLPKVVMAERGRSKKPVVGVIRERYMESNALFSGLAHVDSDADLDREGNRDKDKRKTNRDDKIKSKNRQHEIYVKRHSDDTIGEGIGINSPMEIPTPAVAVKLTDSGRYSSFGMSQSKVLPVSPINPDRVERRPTVTSYTDCPKERLTFFKTFQALINMGSHGKKQKEERILAQRQKSSDEQLYMNCVWIGLQAWLNGLLPQDQQNLMALEREHIPTVIKAIMEFKVQFINLSDQFVSNTDDDSNKPNRNSSCSIDTIATDISQTYHSMALTSEILEQQEEAVKQVQSILERLDRCEQMFPTSHAFAQEYPTYKEPSFVRRIEALYLWLNTTKDLCHKLNVLGQVFSISSSNINTWPFVDFNRCFEVSAIDRGLHRTSIPEIVTGEEDGDENEEEYEEDELNENGEVNNDTNNVTKGQNGQEQKKVSFAFTDKVHTSPSPVSSPKRDRSPLHFGSPPDYSTPLRGYSATSLSRASSEASLDDLSKSSVYRAYVEKGLKKMGLNKMLVRLRDILYRSLRRARQSLEQQNLEADSVTVSISL